MFERVVGCQLSKFLVLDRVSLCHGVRHIWCM